MSLESEPVRSRVEGRITGIIEDMQNHKRRLFAFIETKKTRVEGFSVPVEVLSEAGIDPLSNAEVSVVVDTKAEEEGLMQPAEFMIKTEMISND